jgi:alkanesulfonate monooxygenase SsuD/methylene tetrahydromethanopterin reductase-like flavin-dependent oxidoreductase (luciferase family)
MAMAAATAQAASRGRFRLGIGPSHQPIVEHVYGLRWDRPVRHVREYATVLRELLQKGATHFNGELYRVSVQHAVDGGAGVPVLLSALAPQMCRAAGRVADGVLPWLAPASYVASSIVPEVRAGAAAEGRSAPPIIAENACVLSTDAGAVREAVRRDMGFYLAMPAYRALFDRAGVPGVAEAQKTGWTDAMIEAVIPWGSETRLTDAVLRYFAAGADEVVLSPVGVGDDPAASYERTLEVLSELARSSR